MDRDHHSLISFTHGYSLDAFHEQMLSRSQKDQAVTAKGSQLPCWEGIKLCCLFPQ